jgi:hypothetical protein
MKFHKNLKNVRKFHEFSRNLTKFNDTVWYNTLISFNFYEFRRKVDKIVT